MKTTRLHKSELASFFSDAIDVFLCSASFESRCLTVADSLDRGLVRRALVAENENHLSLHASNAKLLMELFGGRSEHLLLDSTDPLRTADALSHALRYRAKGSRLFVVDITSFTHEAFLILFRYIQKMRRVRVVYLYSGASEYSVGDKDEDKWLSRGIGSIRSVLGYSGRFLPSRRLHLIVLVGFEYERVGELIRQYEPSFISLGYGASTEPDAERHHPPNQQGFNRVKAIYPSSDEFNFFCYDPERTKKIVLEQAGKHDDCNIVVATLNTKISTMGAALAALESDSIQLCYAPALLYNYQGYSAPSERVYVIEP